MGSIERIGDLQPSRISKAAWYTLIVLTLVYVTNAIDRSAMSIVIEPIKHEFHLSDSQLGLLTGLAFGLTYALMGIRNAAVPMAGIGSNAGFVLLMLGVVMRLPPLVWLGIILFSGIVFFQLVNLPVEFDASNRAKAQLVALGK